MSDLLPYPPRATPPPPDVLPIGSRVVVTATSDWQGLATVYDYSSNTDLPARMPCQIHGHKTPQGLFNTQIVPGCPGCNEQWIPMPPFHYWIRTDKSVGGSAFPPESVRLATDEDEANAQNGTLVPATPGWESRLGRR